MGQKSNTRGSVHISLRGHAGVHSSNKDEKEQLQRTDQFSQFGEIIQEDEESYQILSIHDKHNQQTLYQVFNEHHSFGHTLPSSH